MPTLMPPTPALLSPRRLGLPAALARGAGIIAVALLSATLAAQPAADPPPVPAPSGAIPPAPSPAPAPGGAPAAGDAPVDPLSGSAAGTPAATAPPTCESLTDAALGVDTRVAALRSRRAEPVELAAAQEEALALWQQAARLCTGRAGERATRNLDQAERAMALLRPLLRVSEACSRSRRDARLLLDTATAAAGKARWAEAAALFRKADDAWDVAAERCSGPLQAEAQAMRVQLAQDIHNAEHCAPLFDRAARFWQRLRQQSAAMTRPERQRQLDVAETLWREATTECRGEALERAQLLARTAERERGRPWNPTPPSQELLDSLVPPEERLGTAAVAAAAPAPSPSPVSAPPAAARPTPSPTLPVAPSSSAPTAPAATTARPSALSAPSPPPTVGADAAGGVGRAVTSAVAAVASTVRASAAGEALAPAATAAALAVIDVTLSGGERLTGRFTKSEPGNGYSGQGRVQWPNGDVYDGELLGGQPQGTGRFAWRDGRVYEGAWQQGDPQGRGAMRYASGDTYTGDFLKGISHGQGVYAWTSGQRYEGQWIQGQPTGRGDMRFANGDRFSGEFRAGQPNGSGRFDYGSGDTYTGQVRDGLPHGEGTYVWVRGDRYAGGWVAGLKEGRGTMQWTDGTRWEGLYRQDLPTEQGQLVRPAVPGNAPAAVPVSGAEPPR